MATAHKNRPKKNRSRKFKRPVRGVVHDEAFAIDYSKLPADLDADSLAELQAELPKPKKTAKPVEHTVLFNLNVAEMIEAAEGEKVEIEGMRTRNQIYVALTSARLRAGLTVVTEGVLDLVPEGHAFLRTSSSDYMPTAEDIFIPPSLIASASLRDGMVVRGALRTPAEGETMFALSTVEQIDGEDPEEAHGRTPFKELIPIYPEDRILLEGTDDNPLEMRIVDIIAPIGRGQRGLIVAPPRTGKTILLQMLARSVVRNAPDAHLIILLVDERPEEVTDFKRSVPGDRVEVVSSTFDEPASRHIRLADMVIKKAKSMVEAGDDVIILLDSITRLARACNTEAPSNGKLLSGGLEATALQFPKRFFGAARKLEDGGSLTILGTALIDTGSKMDEVIFEEFKGTGNSEIVLDRRLSDRRIYPAIDINLSGTRKEDLLLDEEEMHRIWMLRKVLNELDPVEAMEMLLQKMGKTASNGAFLMSIGS